jgi:Zn-dependent peptidase ImmA (M78 family)/DNA-binding XRE family transcriptional regulator
MTSTTDIGRNLRRARVMADLSQDAAAERAGLSRVAYRNLESGQSRPRPATLDAVAGALGVRVGELMRPAAPMPRARFRSLKRLQAREAILETIAMQLEAYAELEQLLEARVAFALGGVASSLGEAEDRPRRAAELARAELGLGDGPVWDIAGLLEERAGVKLARMPIASDAFFGLSIAADGVGPAIAVNTWDRISVERWIFSAAHELGHLVLHADQFDPAVPAEEPVSEQEANVFASHFLMPAEGFRKEWEQAAGNDLWQRVMKVKEIFRVSYRTVLYRVQEEYGLADIWVRFQAAAKRHIGKTLGKWDEPGRLGAEAFGGGMPEARKADEPRGLPPETFVLDRRAKLVRDAISKGEITLGRGAEILGLRLREMRTLQADWV